jgi:hypothetical protein
MSEQPLAAPAGLARFHRRERLSAARQEKHIAMHLEQAAPASTILYMT